MTEQEAVDSLAYLMELFQGACDDMSESEAALWLEMFRRHQVDIVRSALARYKTETIRTRPVIGEVMARIQQSAYWEDGVRRLEQRRAASAAEHERAAEYEREAAARVSEMDDDTIARHADRLVRAVRAGGFALSRLFRVDSIRSSPFAASMFISALDLESEGRWPA